jgi:hypothetical protein
MPSTRLRRRRRRRSKRPIAPLPPAPRLNVFRIHARRGAIVDDESLLLKLLFLARVIDVFEVEGVDIY